MGKYTKIKLGSFINTLTDYHANGSYKILKENITLKKNLDYAIMIRTLNFERCDFKEDLIYLNEIEYNYLKKTKVYSGDIVMNKIANPGSVYLMPNLKKPVSLAMNLFLIRFNDQLNQRYMFYLMKLSEKYIKSFANGTTTLTITKDSVRKLQFEVPDLSTQNSIASVLSTLDTKIELNNKINSQLEAMAKTLYDYWFVQFDFPDQKGKPYKSSGGQMMWSKELKREIPKGWEVRSLGEVLKKNNKKFNLNNQKHNIDTVDLSVMPSSTMCLNEKNTSDEFETNLFIMNKFDILFGGIRPYLLKAGFAPFDGLVTGTVHSFNTVHEYDYNFVLLTMIHESMFQFAISNSKGTKMPIVGADDLLEYIVAYNEEVVKKFNQILSFKEIISKNIEENQALAELRDWLLPMLMNGQVEVG